MNSRQSVTFYLLPLAFCVLLAGCQRNEAVPLSASGPAAVRVNIVEVKAEPFAATASVTGTLVSRSRVDVKAETIGRLVRFPKEEGDPVAAGEAVAWVNDADYRLAVQQSESAVGVAAAALQRAQVLERHSLSELERAKNLVRSGGITQKDLDAADLAARDARAQVALAEAQLAQARAGLEVSRKRLRDTVIHAPVTGEIQHKFVNPGAYLEAPTSVFTLVDNSRLEMESPVPSSELAPIGPGQPVSFSVAGYPGETFEGRVVEINPALDTDTRSAKVRIQVDNRRRKLKAGMFAQGEIRTGVERQTILIPAAAASRDDRSSKDAFVFVVENGKAVRRPVRTGRQRNGSLEVIEGLRPGDRLVAEQRIEIAEGVRVEAGR